MATRRGDQGLVWLHVGSSEAQVPEIKCARMMLRGKLVYMSSGYGKLKQILFVANIVCGLPVAEYSLEAGYTRLHVCCARGYPWRTSNGDNAHHNIICPADWHMWHGKSSKIHAVMTNFDNKANGLTALRTFFNASGTGTKVCRCHRARCRASWR